MCTCKEEGKVYCDHDPDLHSPFPLIHSDVKALDLQPEHRAMMSVIRIRGGVWGWNECNETLQDLINWELVEGKWGGSLEHLPSPVWTLTEKGQRVV